MGRDDAIEAMRKAIAWTDCNFVGGTDDAVCQYPTKCECRRMAVAAFEALEALDLTVVPIEPTEAMLDAAIAEWRKRVESKIARGAYGEHGPKHPIRENWLHMVAASPLRLT